MLSPTRAYFFLLNFTVFALLALLASSPLMVAPAFAAPLPSPSFRNADFAPRPPHNTSLPGSHSEEENDVYVRDMLSSFESLGGLGALGGLGLPLVRRDVEPRQSSVTNIITNLNLLNQYYSGMQTHATTFRTLIRQPATSRASTFNTQSASELQAFRLDLLGFQTILEQLGSDNGLANFDNTNALEKVLKEMVNSVKYMLTDIDEAVEGIPVLGPTLGPIVYEVKCILDKVLDAVENLTDAILNMIQPLLAPLIGQATATACRSGLQIAGLCLLL